MDLARDRLAESSAEAPHDDYVTCTDGLVDDGPLLPDAVVARLDPLKSLARRAQRRGRRRRHVPMVVGSRERPRAPGFRGRCQGQTSWWQGLERQVQDGGRGVHGRQGPKRVASDGTVRQELRVENAAGAEKRQALRLSADRAVVHVQAPRRWPWKYGMEAADHAVQSHSWRRPGCRGQQLPFHGHRLRLRQRGRGGEGSPDVPGRRRRSARTGWLECDGEFALQTLYYGEYRNEWPGAGTRWPGYRAITNRSMAVQFTVGRFIQGGACLNGTGLDL
ncbi:hypothetical protein QOZ80_1AG0036180 [Eleusine coracana subsp. coracana]|nr:hypothetical protein QOZ80_1AG0036180 [Eleusine coracana subsp. coracana]